MGAQLAIPEGTGLVPGSIIGNKYRIDGCLGEGGMGVVLSATHLELDAPVAIKVVREEYAGSADIVARVLFEARAVARMRSSHVVRVLDVARLESGCPYIVMEQLEGEDLGQALWDRGALPVPQAIDYLLQACDGLAEAHHLGIVHRDLKPGNLFLANTPEGVVLKVLDFGISKEVSTQFSSDSRISRTSLTSAGDPVGSPYYMAPEQMRASPDVDARADIWSLGAILFELLTGQSPFEGETITEVCAKVLTEDPASLCKISNGAPTELDHIIARCLQKDPNRRFQSVNEFAAALRAWRPIEELVVETANVDADPPASKSPPRRSARLPLAMVGSSALLALIAVGFWQTHGSAASLDASRVRPMIAGAAAPIWRALRSAPDVASARPAMSTNLPPESATQPNSFESALVKNSAPIAASPVLPAAAMHTAGIPVATMPAATIPAATMPAATMPAATMPAATMPAAADGAEVPTTTAPAVVPAALDSGQTAPSDPAPSATDAPPAADGDSSTGGVDPVGRRYGL